MTHVYEDEFHRLAHEWLKNSYGEENVHHEYYVTVEIGGQTKTRFIDFVVEDTMTTWAIEAERSAAKVREGVGQCQEYADALRRTDRFNGSITPCILVPFGHSVGESWADPLVTVREAPKFDS